MSHASTAEILPRLRRPTVPALLSAGFRPFFAGAALWAAIGIPLWLALYQGTITWPGGLEPLVWHVHEMIYGFAMATVAGFLLTAVPNWTGRLPIRGGRLALLALLWAAGRVALLFAGAIGMWTAAAIELAFPALLLAAIGREVLAGRNWRNLPVLGGVGTLLAGDVLVMLGALHVAGTADLGNRLGLATVLALIALIGGRIIPSFTRNWLVKMRPGARLPVPANRFDGIVLVLTVLALAAWVADPNGSTTAQFALVAGLANAARLARWRGRHTVAEPLLLVLHAGYGWLAAGLLLLGANGIWPVLPPSAALHALTVGAAGTMTLAVMTRATLGHTGRDLTAGPGTRAIYLLVTLAALLRLAAPLAGTQMVAMLTLAGVAWAGAFGLYLAVYGKALVTPRLAHL